MSNAKRARNNSDKVPRKRKVGIPRTLTKQEMQKPEMVRVHPSSYHSLALYLRAKELYEKAGFNFKETGQLLNVHEGTVQNWAYAGGWDIRPRPTNARRLSHKELNQIIFMYEELKLSTTEIGKVFGKHSTTITKQLGRAGVARRTRKEAGKIHNRKDRVDYRQLRVVNG